MNLERCQLALARCMFRALRCADKDALVPRHEIVLADKVQAALYDARFRRSSALVWPGDLLIRLLEMRCRRLGIDPDDGSPLTPTPTSPIALCAATTYRIWQYQPPDTRRMAA